MKGPGNESGVSVIVGTLLLILITVTAAAGLALMVSQMQKDEMNRQSHLNAVKNENITILNVAFENNQTEWNLTYLDGVQNSQNWSSVKLTLLNLNTDSVVVMGIGINDRYALNFADKSRTDPSVASRTIFNSSNYLRIPATQSRDVYIDFVANASDDPYGFIDYQQAQHFNVGSMQDIKVMTSLTNFFEKVLKPPQSTPQFQMETDNLGTITRDALVLDGSHSTSDNTLVSWIWTIYDASSTVPPGNWTDVTNWTLSNQTFPGKTARVNSLNSSNPYYRATLTVTDNLGMSATSALISIPVGNFNPPTSMELAMTASPICVSNVTGCSYYNSSPFFYSKSTSPSVSSITQFNTSLSATLYDINHNPVPNATVIFVIDTNPNTPQNCFSIDKMANVTDKGTALATVIQNNVTPPICPQPVTMHAQAGKVMSPTILIPGIP